MEQTNTLLICKFHINNKKPIFKSSKNIININKYANTQELLILADILITDYSSIYFDFILLDKPLILFPYDFKEYVSKRGIYHNLEDIATGPIVKTGNELIKSLQEIPKWSKNIKEQVAKIKNKYWDDPDGNTCERVYQKLFLNK